MKNVKINKKNINLICIIVCFILIYIFPTKTLAQGIITNDELESNICNEEYKLTIGYNYPEYGKDPFEEGLRLWIEKNLHNNYELKYYSLDYESGRKDLLNKDLDLLFTYSNAPMNLENGIIESDIIYSSDYYALFEKNTSKELNNVSSNVDLLRGKDVIVIKEDGEIVQTMAKSAIANLDIHIANDLKEALEQYEENKENSILIVGGWRSFDLLSYGYDIERIFPEYKISRATVQAAIENKMLIENINEKLKGDLYYFEKLIKNIRLEKNKDIFRDGSILDKEEIEWIQNNDEIIIKIVQYREPILFKDHNNNLQGLLVDIMEEFSELTNIKVKYEDYLDEFKKQNLSYIAELKENEIYALNYNTNLISEDLFKSFLDINNKIGIVHKEDKLNDLSQIYNDTENPIGVIYGSPSQRYFDEILMKNYKVYYTQSELVSDFNKNKIKYFSTLEMNFSEIQLEYDEIAFFKELESIRSFPMFLFDKESLNYNIFKKAIRFINWYELNDYWQNDMNSKINKKTNERFNKSIELTKTNTFIVTLSIMVIFILLIVIFFSFRSNEKNKQLKSALSKLEMAQKAKNLFFANMSHEIRTPIYTILGMNYFLKNQKY